MSSTPRFTYLSFLLRFRWYVLALSVLIAVVGTYRTVKTYSELRSDLAELLPENAPSVRAFTELRARLPGIRHLGVVVDVPNPEALPAAHRFIDALAERTRAYPKELVAAVRVDSRAEREFAERYALQLMDPDDVRKLKEAVERRRDWEVARQLGIDLEDETEDPKPEIPFAELRKKYEAYFGKARFGDSDRFVSSDGKTVVLLIQASAQDTGTRADTALLDRVKAEVSALGFPSAFDGRLRVGYGGDVATRVEEAQGLESDLTLSGLLVSALVVGVLVWFFGSLRSLPILGIPLIVGTVAAFGVVALPPLSIRSLNSNTAFLGSIVIGNGINAGIILLARYLEERRTGAALQRSIDVAVRDTALATLAASLAAAAAYGSLVFTDFRGFNQFGWIGAFGLMLCWAAMYTLVPIFLYWFGAPLGSVQAQAPQPASATASFGGRLLAALRPARWLGVLRRRPQIVLAGTVVVCLFAVFGLVRRANDWIEYDLSKLRRADSWQSGERYWGPRMDSALGRYLTPTVILAHAPEQARIITERVRQLSERGGAGGLIAQVRSLETFLPPERDRSLEEARQLRELLTPRMKADLSPRDRQVVERSLSDEALVRLELPQLPASLLMGLREYDGRIDRNVLVFPKLTPGTWNAERLDEFARDLRVAATVGGQAAPVAGGLPLAGDIAKAMKADGPRATAISLAAVLVICWFAFRGKSETGSSANRVSAGRSIAFSLGAIGSLLIAVVLMLGVLAWTGEKINFCNFVALPITFGIGADYGINVLRRYLVETDPAERLSSASPPAPGGIGGALANTSNAVTLCSATTVIGYGSLVMAQNRALSSFGTAAIAGELASLVVGVVALPAALTVWERLQRRRGDERISQVTGSELGSIPPLSTERVRPQAAPRAPLESRPEPNSAARR